MTVPPQGPSPRLWRRLGRSFVSADSYGLVLLLVMVTYIVSVSVTETGPLPSCSPFSWQRSGSHSAPRRHSVGSGLIAGIVLCLAAAAVVVSLFVHNPGDQLGGIFTICCLLYLIAPFSIVRHLLTRRVIDTETLLGAMAAYLPGPVLQLRHHDHRRVQEPGAGRQPGQTFAVLEAVTGQLFLIGRREDHHSMQPRRGERSGS